MTIEEEWSESFTQAAPAIENVPLFYPAENDETFLNLCGKGMACACAAGGSHMTCFVLPALLGGTGALGASFLGAAMWVLSPAAAVAATWGIDRAFGIKRGFRRAAIGYGLSAGAALGMTLGLQAVWPHQHMNNGEIARVLSLPDAAREDELRVLRARYDRLPPVLARRIEAAARDHGIDADKPELYLLGCDFSNDLGRDILAFERDVRRSAKALSAPLLTP